MPPELALLGCTAFVLVMLRVDRKEAVGVTWFLWVPTLWFLLIFSRPLSLWFGTGGSTNEEGSPFDQVFLLTLFFIALVVVGRRQFSWANAFRNNRWVLCLLMFSLLSVLWSEISFISFRRWVTAAIAIVMILSVHSEPCPRAAVESILKRVIYICVPFSYILIHYYPDYGKIYVHNIGSEMWTGVAIHKNSLAQLCLVSILFLVWRMSGNYRIQKRSSVEKLGKWGDFALLAITIMIFIGPDRSMTYSATSTLATVAGLTVFVGLYRFHKRGRPPACSLVVGGIAFVIVYGIITPFLGKLSLFDVSAMVGRSSDLTGRADVWAALMPEVMKQPILGHGYGAFWTTEARNFYDISDAHNGYLGTILETGMMGITLFAVLMLSLVNSAHSMLTTDFRLGALSLMILTGALLHNIAEQSLNEFTGRLMAVSLLATVSYKGHGVAPRWN